MSPSSSRLSLVALLVLGSAFGGYVVACSSSSGTTPGSVDAGQGGAPLGPDGAVGDAQGGQDTGVPRDAGAADAISGDPDKACAAMMTDPCNQCCAQNHPAGDMVFTTASDTCICDPSHCATQCAQTDCSSANDAGSSKPGDPCNLCQTPLLDDGGVCAAAIATACNASADCKAFQACSDRCP